MLCKRNFNLASTCSAIDSWTKSLEPAQHTWPWLKKIELMMPSTAWSIGASSIMIFADLPPSSSVTFLEVPIQAFWICFPTAVLPVKAILSTFGCATNAAPVSPYPVTILTTPAGSPASWQISANLSAVSEVVSAGLSTTVLPHAKAGATFQASISNGKFHGVIWPATPNASICCPGKASCNLSAQPA